MKDVGKTYASHQSASHIILLLISASVIDSITLCAWVHGRVKRLGLSACVCNKKNTAIYCLSARKLPRNSPLLLGFATPIIRKMSTKLGESFVECYGHGFLIVPLLIRTLRSGDRVCRPGRA